ncbi:MAG: hypothetical protein B7X28_03810 [Halothiobacillus sp. 13-55-253]|jgi:phosphoglycolate phosphatase|nr:MAG: hypothetical protein B7X28_03810 [Halothiobacillus sp. 13-55-253]
MNPVLTPPQLIIFDWDGTLVQSTGHIVRSFEMAIAHSNLPPLAPETIQGIIGLGLVEACQALYPNLSLEQAQALGKTYQQFYFSRTDTLETYAGATTLLNDLRESGCWLAIATGKSNRGLHEALEETGLGHYFLGTRTAEQTASKPSPLMLMELLDEFGLEPAQAWMIGDTDFDLLMAHNAGCVPIAITHGAHEIERLHAAKPAAVIHDLPSLLPLYQSATAQKASQNKVSTYE